MEGRGLDDGEGPPAKQKHHLGHGCWYEKYEQAKGFFSSWATPSRSFQKRPWCPSTMRGSFLGELNERGVVIHSSKIDGKTARQLADVAWVGEFILVDEGVDLIISFVCTLWSGRYTGK
jgi:hypothetical protein